MKTCARDTSRLVLETLADSPQHGRGIIGDARRISGGRVRLRAGALYAALDRLQAEGLVETAHETVVDGRPLRYYRARPAAPDRRRPARSARPAVRTVPCGPCGRTHRPPPPPPAPASVPSPSPSPTSSSSSSPSVSGRTASAPSRLAWLDALRGIAAMMVVLDHASSAFLPGFRRQLMPWFDCGRYGVVLFFLVSGYVIPASLERRGSVRAFWIGRAFRMYPLWAAAVSAVTLLYLTGHAQLRAELPDASAASVAAAVLAHVTLLQELLGTESVLIVLWTLSYEVCFYLLTVALFAFRRHQRSAPVAVSLAGLSVLALAAGAFAGTPRPSALSAAVGAVPLTFAAAAVLAAAVCCSLARSRSLRVCGAVLGAGLVLVLVPFNGTVPPWEGLLILAVMFLGTAVHRADHGRSPGRSAAPAAAAVLASALVCAAAYGGSGFNRRGWTVAFVLAALTFWAGRALRHRRLPRPLTGLGTISYSVYLLHPMLLAAAGAAVGSPGRGGLAAASGFLAVLLPLCVLTHRYIEAPGQAWGRRLADRAGRTPSRE
jgi:peptidoglycan/LPS O-acetylase OafA/YrhL